MTDLAFNPFAPHVLAVASEDGVAHITTLPTSGGVTDTIGAASASLRGHARRITACRWHPAAANVLATCATDNTVRVWDVEEGVSKLSVDERANAMAWNADGSLLVINSEDKKSKFFDPRGRPGGSGVAITAVADFGSMRQRVLFSPHATDRFLITGVQTGARALMLHDRRNPTQPLRTITVDNAAGAFQPAVDPDLPVRALPLPCPALPCPLLLALVVLD